MVSLKAREVVIAGAPAVAEAILNNCAGSWTATVRANGRLVASGAGSDADAALASAIERAEQASQRRVQAEPRA
jgi:hypothetical protein